MVESIGVFGALNGAIHIDQGRTFTCPQAAISASLFCQIPERTQGRVKVDQNLLYAQLCMELGNSSQMSNIFRYNRKVLTIIDGNKHY